MCNPDNDHDKRYFFHVMTLSVVHRMLDMRYNNQRRE